MDYCSGSNLVSPLENKSLLLFVAALMGLGGGGGGLVSQLAEDEFVIIGK